MYTQGEWANSHEQDGYTQFLYGNDTGKEQLCSVLWGMGIPKEQREANAHLIAQSPKLYEYIKGKAENGDNDAKCFLAVLELE